MTSTRRRAHVVAILLLPPAVAGGQQTRLSAEEVLAAAPAMSAELRDLRAAAGFIREWKEGASIAMEDRRATAEAVRDGRVDPLAWSKERYPGLSLPEGYRYSAACSRSATAAHNLSAVVVVLTSGATSVDYAPERMSRLKEEEVLRMMLEDTFLTAATKRRMAAAAAFFESRGLLVGYQPGFTTFETRDGRLSGAIHDHNQACREMPTGPYLELSVEPESPRQPSQAPPALDQALRASGLTEDRYRAIVYRLVRARHFAEHPGSLEAAGAGQADRRDVELYSRLRGKLEPQLGELIRVQGGGR